MKHGGRASATARQQTYCASNFEQGGGDSIARNCWRYAGETLEMIFA